MCLIEKKKDDCSVQTVTRRWLKGDRCLDTDRREADVRIRWLTENEAKVYNVARKMLCVKRGKSYE